MAAYVPTSMVVPVEELQSWGDAKKRDTKSYVSAAVAAAAATKATGEAGAGAGSGSGSGAGTGAGAGIGKPAKNGADGEETSPFSIQEHLNAKMVLWGGDLCSLNTDAIVNTTNEALRDRTGISGQIFRRAGPDLVQRSRALSRKAAEQVLLWSRRAATFLQSISFILLVLDIMKSIGKQQRTPFTVATEAPCSI